MTALAELSRADAPAGAPVGDPPVPPYSSGDGMMPYPVLVRLLGAATAAGGSATAPAEAPRLTARQTAVLTLMAEGHGNTAIARTLACSEHTVKNVIYALMGRLQARNRAHAVACAVRHSLI